MMQQWGAGALTPVQEESSTLGPSRESSRKDASDGSPSAASKARAGVSNDHLPTIKSRKQQGSPTPAQNNVKPVHHHQTTSSLGSPSQRAKAQQQQQHTQPQPQQAKGWQALSGKPITSIAAAAAALQQQQQQTAVQVSPGNSSSYQAGPQSPQRAQPQQLQQPQPPGLPVRQGTGLSALNIPVRPTSRAASISPRRSKSQSQYRWQQEAEEDPFLAQRQLHQLPGLEGAYNPAAEAEAGRRIVALPHVLCRAANGELYRMETGHVQSMMLRRQLAELGIDMTDEEESLLTTGAVTGAQFIPTRLAARGSFANSGLLSRTGSATPSWIGNRSSGIGGVMTPIDSRAPSTHNTSWSGAALKGRGGRSSMLGGIRRSAVGAALDAHAAAEGLRSQHQVILDDEVLDRIAQLDLFVENWRNQLAEQAEAAKAAKAAKAAAERDAAAADSDEHDSHHQRKKHTRAERRAREGSLKASIGSGKGWKAVRHVVELNIANWQQHRALANRWKQPDKPPTWEDVILMGDVYIKRRSGQGVAVYEARCAELGITPVSQVIQQLERPQANMAHCKLGYDGAKALGAALSAASNIVALDLRDNGLDGKAVTMILSGIATATASALTERTKQHNIQMANQTMATIGANMQAASVAQPPYQFTEDTVQPFAAPVEAYSSAGSPKQQPNKRGAGTGGVTWRAKEPDVDSPNTAGAGGPLEDDPSSRWLASSPSAKNIMHRSASKAGDEGRPPAASWAVSSRSGHGPDCPDNSQSGGRSSGAIVADGPVDTELLMESITGQLSGMYPAAEASNADLDGFDAVQGPGAEAQLALQNVTPGSMSKTSLAKIGQHAVGGQLFLAQRLSNTGASEGPGSPSRTRGADAADLGLDMDEAELQQFTSVPASPTPHLAGGAAAGGSVEAPSCPHVRHIRQPSLAAQSSGAGSQQGPASPAARGVSKLQLGARRSGAYEQGNVYSAMSDLDLSQNPIGVAGAKAVAELLNPGSNPSQFLVSLNLSKCNLPEAGGLVIAAALQSGNLKLRRLGLSNNSLGNKTAAAFGDVLESNHTLMELDLGWNQIKAEGAKALARGLAANATLSELVLCWNGLEAAGGAAVGEMLGLNMGLKVLDLSHCRLGPEACLLLGEGLKSNVVLEVLLLAGNDIGEDGARHLMTALAANNSLKFLGLSGSNLTSAVHDAAGSAADFNPASPDGSYTLDLSVAAERAVAMQLIELDRAQTTDLMKNITLDGKAVASAKKANWPTLLPSRGVLSCNFSSSSVKKPLAIMESSKLATLRRQLTVSSMSDRERLELVAMFAPFALFTCKQIASVINTFSIGPERVAASALLYTRAADSATDLVSLTGLMTGHDLLGWRDVMGWYAGYRWNQPTGHYELNLALPVHAAIAARLRDDSQSCPEGATWINLMHDMATTCQKQPQGHGPPPDWRAVIPTSGTLSLDYVSTHPPGVTAQTTLWGAPRTSGAGAAVASPTAARASAVGPAGTTGGARGSVAAAAGTAAAAGGTRGSVAAPAGGTAAAVGSTVGQGEPGTLIAVSDQHLESLMRTQMGIPLPSSSSGAPGGLTTAAAQAAALTDVAAADAAVMALRQAAAAGLLLTCSQVRILVEAFALSPHRVEVAVICWPITLDREESYWTVLYLLQGIEQSNLLQRLGPWRLYQPQHASCHWVLDLCNPGHEEVAKKLVALAVGGGELPNFWNIRLRGVKKQVNENQNMWGMLTAESFTPFLEFDFLGPDAWTSLGKTDKEVAAMTPGDKLEMRTKQAARLEVVRMKQLYPYSCDGSSWPRPPYATYDSLMAPQLAKSPWVAAWDRLVRVLLRLEMWAGGLSRDSSALQEAFEAAAESEQRVPAQQEGDTGRAEGANDAEGELCITATELEELLRSWGYNRQEMNHYLKLMEDHLKAEAAAKAAAAAAANAAQEAAQAAAAAAAEQDTEDSSAEPGTPGSSKAAGAASLRKSTSSAIKAGRDSSSKPGSRQTSTTGSLGDGKDAVPGTPNGKAAGANKAGATRFASGDGSSVSSKEGSDTNEEPAEAGSTAASGSAAGRKGAAGRASNNGGKAAANGSKAVSRQQSTKGSAVAANLEATYDRGLTFDEFVKVIMTEAPKALRLKDVVSSMTAMLGAVAGGGAGGLLARLKQNKDASASADVPTSSESSGVEKNVEEQQYQ